MAKINLDYFRDALRIKHVELAPRSRTREHIVIERSPDTLEEAAFKSAREIAVVQLHRESVIRLDVALTLKRLDDQTFGECVHCWGEISLRRLEAVPWAPFASIVKSPPIAATKVYLQALRRLSSM